MHKSAIVAGLCLALVAVGYNAKAQFSPGGGGGLTSSDLQSWLDTNKYVKQTGTISPGNMTKFSNQLVIADGGTLDQISFTQPSSGFNATIPNGIRYYIIGNAGLLAAGALTMPASPVDGQRVTITSRSGITLFSISANSGQTLYGGLASLSGFATWIYRASDTSWYRVG